MKTYTYDQSDEKRILIGLVVSKELLDRLSTVWQKGLFSSAWANLIAKWCFEYHEKYQMAPGSDIKPLVASWEIKQGGRAKEDSEAIERLLTQLEDQYQQSEDLNVQSLVDLAAKVFNEKKIKELITQLQDDIQEGNVLGAQSKIKEFTGIQLGMSSTVNVYEDLEAAYSVLESSFVEPLVRYPKDIGRFFGGALARDCFVAFAGREKIGKSFWLLDLAYRAVKQRRKVAMFQVGDMTLEQVQNRIIPRTLKRPMRAGVIKYPCNLRWDDSPGENGYTGVSLDYEDRSWNDDVEKHDIEKGYSLMKYLYTRTATPLFKLEIHTAGLEVKQIQACCNDWLRREGWEADIIVIDYCDLLGAPYKEERDRINSVWTDLRALSQRRHCLIVTATQVNAEAYRKRTLDMRNFSGDKRKNAHPTGMVGINCDDQEKSMGIYRLNWIHQRSEDSSANRCCYTTSCLSIANPCIESLY